MTKQDEIEITLIIPVYDEEKNIVDLFVEIDKKIEHPHKALIIYDRDDDTTLKNKDTLVNQYQNIQFVKNEFGHGVIDAFKTGFQMADTKYIVPIMADLSDMPETVNKMYDKIKEGYDLVVASRYVAGGAKVGGPVIKYILSKIANLSLHYLTGIPTHDMTNAFIMYRKHVVDGIEITSTGGFELTMEIMAKAYVQGHNITEVPTINRDRKAGKSQFKLLAWIFKYLYWYFYLLRKTAMKSLMGYYKSNDK